MCRVNGSKPNKVYLQKAEENFRKSEFPHLLRSASFTNFCELKTNRCIFETSKGSSFVFSLSSLENSMLHSKHLLSGKSTVVEYFIIKKTLRENTRALLLTLFVCYVHWLMFLTKTTNRYR